MGSRLADYHQHSVPLKFDAMGCRSAMHMVEHFAINGCKARGRIGIAKG